MKKYCYLARPMASYGIPGASMIPTELYQNLLEQGYTFLDPAFDLEIGDVKGKGMDPWIKVVQRHCDLLITIISQGVITSGVAAEIEAARDFGIQVIYPFGKLRRYLSIREAVIYNSMGAFIITPMAKHSRFVGFTASVYQIDPSIPVITPGQH